MPTLQAEPESCRKPGTGFRKEQGWLCICWPEVRVCLCFKTWASMIYRAVTQPGFMCWELQHVFLDVCGALQTSGRQVTLQNLGLEAQRQVTSDCLVQF